MIKAWEGHPPLPEPDEPHLLLGTLPLGGLRGLRQAREPPPPARSSPGRLDFFQHMTGEELESGVLVATRGNHGLAMACAGRWFDVPCTVVVPEGNNPEINRIVESFGAELIVHGQDFYDQVYRDELVDSAGYYYVEQATNPRSSTVSAPWGWRSSNTFRRQQQSYPLSAAARAAPRCIKVAQAINPQVEVIGVQAERVAAFYTSWKQGEWVVIDTATTIADGLAARSVFKLPYVIMKDHIADVVLLSEEEIIDGIRLALGVTHNLAEGAGAASLAAAVKIKDRLAGKKVALVMSGGNLDHAHLLQALA